MSLIRRGVFFLISLLLLSGLIGLAFSISTNMTLGKASKVEKLLAESKFYDSFAANTIKQAEESSIGGIGQGGISFSDPLIQQASKEALNAQYLEAQGKTLIQNNYLWLEGKKQQPDFRIDLTPAREDFARLAGQALTAKLQALPPCSAQQSAQIQASGTTNASSLTCRPANLDPQTEGNRLTTELTENSAFLSNPIITPSSLNPAESSETEPYYDRFSGLPAAYQLSLKAPYIFGFITVLSLILLYFAAIPKRKFTRRLTAVLIAAGVILILNKIIADLVFKRLQEQTFKAGNIGALEQSVLDFFHRIESELVKVDLYFGIAYMLLAAALLFALQKSRGARKAKPSTSTARAFTTPPASSGASSTAPESLDEPFDDRLGPDSGLTNNMRLRRKPTSAVIDIAPSSRTTAPTMPKLKSTRPTPIPGQKPRKKPPRLIQ